MKKIKILTDKQLRKELTKWITKWYLPEDTDIVLEEHSTEFKPKPPHKTMKREDVCIGPMGHSYHDRILDYIFGATYFYKYMQEKK